MQIIYLICEPKVQERKFSSFELEELPILNCMNTITTALLLRTLGEKILCSDFALYIKSAL